MPHASASSPSFAPSARGRWGRFPVRAGEWMPRSFACGRRAADARDLPHAFSVQEWIVAFRYPGRHSLRSFALG
jgi:hypothetical protein